MDRIHRKSRLALSGLHDIIPGLDNGFGYDACSAIVKFEKRNS